MFDALTRLFRRNAGTALADQTSSQRAMTVYQYPSDSESDEEGLNVATSPTDSDSTTESTASDAATESSQHDSVAPSERSSWWFPNADLTSDESMSEPEAATDDQPAGNPVTLTPAMRTVGRRNRRSIKRKVPSFDLQTSRPGKKQRVDNNEPSKPARIYNVTIKQTLRDEGAPATVFFICGDIATSEQLKDTRVEAIGRLDVNGPWFGLTRKTEALPLARPITHYLYKMECVEKHRRFGALRQLSANQFLVVREGK